MRLAQNIDFAPTFLEAAGVEVPEDIQGMSLKPLLKSEQKAQKWRNVLYYHYYEKGEHRVPRHEGIRTDRYKLIWFYDTDEWEFYDLAKEPNEMKSGYNDSDNADLIRELKIALDKERAKFGIPKPV